MNKRYLLSLSILAILAGCEDGASGGGSDVDPCSACTSNQICEDGVCKPAPGSPCSQCNAMEECINDKCEPKRPSDDPCSACLDDQVCIDKTCQEKSSKECNPQCGEGKECVDGRCAICIGTNCFFESDDGNQFCDTTEECPEGLTCFEGECQEMVVSQCDPECTDGQVCVNGTCQSSTLLWTLCRSGSDCGVGDCIFSVTPSKDIRLELDGEIHEYAPDVPIPLNLLDTRINVENYNKTHSNKAGESDEIGVCAFECTKQEDKICPSGWACQVVAKGIPDYPDISLLPQELPESMLNETPFAAICRRKMNEEVQKDIPYGIELCNSDESDCVAAGMVFYDGMCLEPCTTSDERCPYFFSCTDVETASGSTKACVPDSGTCTSCYDHDKDGAGYGHCTIKGIDCDDDNPNAYYQKPLVCSDIKDDSGNEIKTDLNCNGIIDKFELVGTTDHCASCDDVCVKPTSPNLTVACNPTDADGFDSEWYKTATMETAVPEFACVEKCSFGYGDCKGNASCDVALLSADARAAAQDSTGVLVSAQDVFSNNGAVYALDEDGDGYPTIDVINSQSPADPADRKLILDANNSVICCASDNNNCYTANYDWTSVTLDSTTHVVENDDGSHTVLKYVSPKKVNSIDSYDINDKNASIRPNAIEACDGVDNDGSTLLARETAEPCREWCAEVDEQNKLLHETECKEFTNTVDGVKKYALNPYCDATEDGSLDPRGWTDITDDSNHAYLSECKKRSNKGDVCNDGVVTCQANPEISCAAGSTDCGCVVGDNHYAFRITAENTVVNADGTVSYTPHSADYVKHVSTSGGLSAVNCRCDGSFCEGDSCDGKDSIECFGECNKACKIQLDHALSCTVDNKSNAVDGLNAKGEPFFDGIDDDCDGRVDEDAMVPCVITMNAPYETLKKGIAEAFKAFSSAKDYNLAADAKNNDGSINLCRIGILQSQAEVKNGVTTYKPICVPLFEPRSYDFFGDEFDSNCDGVDYDLDHTVFVTNNDQGELLGVDTDTCGRFTPSSDPKKKGYVTPCATLPKAFERAGADYKNGTNTPTFYDDIIVRGSTFTVDRASTDGSLAYGIKVPTIAQQTNRFKLFQYSGEKLPNEADHVKEGHIISAYKLHQLLVDSKRKKASFNPNIYYFNYWESTEVNYLDENGKVAKKSTYVLKDKQAEQLHPEEVLRVYGGFDRAMNKNSVMDSEYDLWTRSDDKAQTTFNWNFDLNSKSIYAFIQPNTTNPLSMRLDGFQIDVKSNAGTLPFSMIDGATFIGINAMTGASLLNLHNVKLTVTAPAGYSYDSKAYADSGSVGIDGGNAWRNEGPSGKDSGYISNFNNNSCNWSPTCGSGINSSTAQNKGGCGGHAWTTKNYNTNNSLSDDDGKKGNEGRKGQGGSLGGAHGTCGGMGGGSDWYCPKLWDHSSAQAYNGGGGAPGKNGDSQTTLKSMKFDIKTTSYPYTLSVTSDRSGAQGHYGSPGGGGGGGAVYQCWEGNGSNDGRCYAGTGGNGGCGGKGGRAGGTGGTAIGVAVRSVSSMNATRILLDDSMVKTTNGSGGAPQPGGAGGAGGSGGYWYAYARCGGTAKICSDTQDQGMGGGGSGGGGGAGGDGGGGVAGWTYPFVLTCKNGALASGKDFDDNVLSTMENCGFKLPLDFVLNASTHGNQDTAGTRVKDIVYTDETRAAKTGQKRARPSDLSKNFRGFMSGSLRWSRDSPYGDQNCGGSSAYSVPGGEGGPAQAVNSTDTVKDTSCLRNGSSAIIIKAVKE